MRIEFLFDIRVLVYVRTVLTPRVLVQGCSLELISVLTSLAYGSTWTWHLLYTV